MIVKCHKKTLRHALGIAALVACFGGSVYSQSLPTKKVAQQAKDKAAPVSFEELDTEVEKDAPEKTEETEKATEEQVLPAPKTAKKSPLPDVNQLVEAKISALKANLLKQEEALAQAESKLVQEQSLEDKIFDTNAYFSLSIVNNAPASEYELKNTAIYVDGRRIARGGKRFDGLPRSEEIFFGPVQPGCHDVMIKANYRRLKRGLLGKFKVNQIERITRSQAFVAKNGFRVELIIEGYEQQNTLLNWYRGPAVRFNRSVRPNFLPGAPIVSMDDVLKQGRVHIDYVTEDGSSYRLLEKSLSIDGLPILQKEKHDQGQKTVVFEGPLAEGSHKLHVVLLFGEIPWVKGGPMYNFRLTFERDFYVIGGQTTQVNLTGIPNNGFRSAPDQTRYGRATTRILSTENKDFFPDMTCKAISDAEKARDQKLRKEQLVAPPAPTAPEMVAPPLEAPPPGLAIPPVESTSPEAPLSPDLPAGPSPVEGIVPPAEGTQPKMPKKASPVEENKEAPQVSPSQEQKTDEQKAPAQTPSGAPEDNKGKTESPLSQVEGVN